MAVTTLRKYIQCILSALFSCAILSCCSAPPQPLIAPALPPFFYDDSDHHALIAALKEHGHYLSGLAEDTEVRINGDDLPAGWLVESLETFQEIVELEPSPLEFNRILHENFDIIQAGGRNNHPQGEMLITGYFEPYLQGSLNRSPPFLYPLYSPPADMIKQKSAGEKSSIVRLDENGTSSPYWTREEIEETGILQGQELVFLKSRFDAFLLHIQGSGKIMLDDGSTRSIQYRGNNGHSYSSIGKLLVDRGKLSLNEVDTAAIRSYLLNHPEEVSEILYHNKRYIFFGWAEDRPPVGSLGLPLTPGRSIAVDRRTLPMGTVAYLVSRKPVLNDQGEISHWLPLHRFVLPQDSGSAILGAGRADLFWGNGEYAEVAAGAMKEKGRLYFLIKNDFEMSHE